MVAGSEEGSDEDPREFEEKLRRFIIANAIEAEQIVFERSVHTVKEAAKELGARPSDLIKSVVLLHGKEVIVAIVSGNDRVSPPRVGTALGLPAPRLASPGEVLRYTGYPAGGVPPFGYAATVLVDPEVMAKDIVYGGGGSDRALLKIRPSELLRASAGRIAEVGDVRRGT